MAHANTYWNHNGKYQAAVAALQALVPDEGAVKNPAKNKALEKFRKASNCYYDLYNNGLCNRAQSFAKVFGIAAGQYRGYATYRFAETLYIQTEAQMDEIVKAAALEQGIAL